MSRCVWVLVGLVCCLTSAGCAKKPPAFTEAEGIVLLNGAPLPHAQVEFVPELDHFGAEMNSSAVTDDKGRFTLMTAKGEPGAAVCSHRVVISEGPVPEKLRGMSQQAQEGSTKFYASLKNRPIPGAYESMVKTPLRIEVKADQKEYKIELKR